MGKKINRLLAFFDNLKGDKIIWMIVLVLMMLSVLSIYSSTSALAIKGSSRFMIMSGQVTIVMIGILIIFSIYFLLANIRILRFFSSLGFIISFVALLLLASHVNLGFIKAEQINGAWRSLKIVGKQFHIFEMVKIAMIMYIAWALHYYNHTKFKIINYFAKYKRLKFIKENWFKLLLFIYGPILIITALVALGSNSSAIIIFAILLATCLIGERPFMEVFSVALIAFLLGVGIFLVAKSSFGKNSNSTGRLETLVSRLKSSGNVKAFYLEDEKSEEFKKAKDKIYQAKSAMIAIHEGGLKGKGPGNSTQRYLVPIIYEDYMFSFLVEEYGSIITFFLFSLVYLGLLTRGRTLAIKCSSLFSQTAVGSLCLLISGQAMFHLFVNLDFGIVTGQTLPMISHGNTSFICLSIAFGIILAISKMIDKKYEAEEESSSKIKTKEVEEKPLSPEDDLNESMQDLNTLDAY